MSRIIRESSATTLPAAQSSAGTAQRLLFGGLVTDSPRADLGLLVLRVVAGFYLALGHGIGKVPPSERFVGGVAEMGFPFPELFASLAGVAEFGGGLLLVVGLLTRPAAFLV